jgi:hypothetical protein
LPSAFSRIAATGWDPHAEQQKDPVFLTNMASRSLVGCHSDSGRTRVSSPLTGGSGRDVSSFDFLPLDFLPLDPLGAADASRASARALSRVFSCVVSVPVNALRG